MELPPEALEGRENFDITPTSPEGPIAYDYDTTDDINSTSEFVKAAEAARGDAIYEALTPTQQAVILEQEGALTGQTDRLAKLAAEKADEFERQTIAQGKLLEETGEFDHLFEPAPPPSEAATRPDDIDPAQRPDELGPFGGIPLPTVPNPEEYSDLRSSQEEYLKALQDRDYSRDKYAALTNFGLNLMSEAPRYEGEGFLSIAGRAGKEPLAQLTKISEAERDAGLGFLKAKMDIEGVRANLKTSGEQKYFDNIIARAIAGAKITTAEAAWLKAKMPDFKTGSLSSTELKQFKIHLNPIVDRFEQDIAGVAQGMKDAKWRGDTGKAAKQLIADMKNPESDLYGELAFRTEEIYENQVGPKDKNKAAIQSLSEYIYGSGGGEHIPTSWHSFITGAGKNIRDPN